MVTLSKRHMKHDKPIRLTNPTPDQQACRDMLSEWVCGDHHLPPVYEWGTGVSINFYGDLSTYDFNRLTMLVLLAHRDAIRVEISSSGPRMVRIIAHKRQHGGDRQYNRHPDLNDLIAMIQKIQPYVCPRCGGELLHTMTTSSVEVDTSFSPNQSRRGNMTKQPCPWCIPGIDNCHCTQEEIEAHYDLQLQVDLAIQDKARRSHWNPPETAPKDGNPFLGDFGYPWPIYCVWDAYDEHWCIVTLQCCHMEDGPNNTYFETDTELLPELKRWTPLPAM